MRTLVLGLAITACCLFHVQCDVDVIPGGKRGRECFLTGGTHVARKNAFCESPG